MKSYFSKIFKNFLLLTGLIGLCRSRKLAGVNQGDFTCFLVEKCVLYVYVSKKVTWGEVTLLSHELLPQKRKILS